MAKGDGDVDHLAAPDPEVLGPADPPPFIHGRPRWITHDPPQRRGAKSACIALQVIDRFDDVLMHWPIHKDGGRAENWLANRRPAFPSGRRGFGLDRITAYSARRGPLAAITSRVHDGRVSPRRRRSPKLLKRRHRRTSSTGAGTPEIRAPRGYIEKDELSARKGRAATTPCFYTADGRAVPRLPYVDRT